ncbi:hypothetical protein MKEN_00063300 [Mycena kentingensis (nom. inval.)]|nr:hypothetical protein MKEN_00063300 [Mycena kentingensis (nom. inval.)]
MSVPVFIVTGANGGVGFGICKRLLLQLSTENPPDSWPQQWATRSTHPDVALEPPTANGLTLILACRSVARAEAARDDLYHQLDAHIKLLRKHKEYDGYADEFRHNLTIEVEQVDLARLDTVFAFAQRVAARHPYISHLIFNAGAANWTGIIWSIAIRQLCTDFLGAFIRPLFGRQSQGDMSEDGLGLTFQANLFGHYAMFRALEPLLQNPSYEPDARVIWSSSLESTPRFYDPSDWQLVKNPKSYESVKYQIDLVATVLAHRASQCHATKRVQHFVSQPGIAHTKIAGGIAAVGGFLDTCKLMLFYLVRILFNTRHHAISTTNAAIAAVHLSLVAMSFVTFSPKGKPTNGHVNGNGHAPVLPPTFKGVNLSEPVRFGAECTRWGDPEVGLTPVEAWKENEPNAEALVVHCEELYDSFVARRKTNA